MTDLEKKQYKRIKELEDIKAKKVCLCDDDKWEDCIWMVNCMSVIPKMK